MLRLPEYIKSSELVAALEEHTDWRLGSERRESDECFTGCDECCESLCVSVHNDIHRALMCVDLPRCSFCTKYVDECQCVPSTSAMLAGNGYDPETMMAKSSGGRNNSNEDDIHPGQPGSTMSKMPDLVHLL